MSKTTKWIYIALFCILLGGAVIVSVGSMNGWDPSNFSSVVHLTQKEFTIKEDFRTIDMRGCGGADVTLLPAEDGVCRVTAATGDEDGVKTTVEVRSGVLYVEREDTRPWHQRVSFNIWSGEDRVTIRLPEALLTEQELLCSSSDVTVESGLAFGTAAVACGSGEIRFLADAEESLSLKTGSGDVALSGAACGDVTITCTSGRIRAQELSCRSFQGGTGSGDIRLESVQAERDLQLKSGSGELRLSAVGAGGALTLETGSGDIRLDEVDAASMDIRSSSGEVKGTVARRMDFRGHTGSGDLSLPEPDPKGGAFYVKTGSGDVKITLG